MDAYIVENKSKSSKKIYRSILRGDCFIVPSRKDKVFFAWYSYQEMPVNRYAIFTDVSLNPSLKIGFGAYLVVHSSFLEIPPEGIIQSALIDQIKLRRFEAVSSSNLEVQTLLWALEDFQKEVSGLRSGMLEVYSDSQCVTGLLRRRLHLEVHGFCSRGRHRLLKNAALYRKFYEFHDTLGFDVVKVSGHVRSRSHDSIHRIFSFVDKEARKALRILREGGGSEAS